MKKRMRDLMIQFGNNPKEPQAWLHHLMVAVDTKNDDDDKVNSNKNNARSNSYLHTEYIRQYLRSTEYIAQQRNKRRGEGTPKNDTLGNLIPRRSGNKISRDDNFHPTTKLGRWAWTLELAVSGCPLSVPARVRRLRFQR